MVVKLRVGSAPVRVPWLWRISRMARQHGGWRMRGETMSLEEADEGATHRWSASNALLIKRLAAYPRKALLPVCVTSRLPARLQNLCEAYCQLRNRQLHGEPLEECAAHNTPCTKRAERSSL